MTREEFNEWLKKNDFNDLNSTNFYGASPAHRAANDGNKSALEYIARHAPKLLSERNKEGKTPAHYAARSGNFDSLEFIAKYAPKTFSMKDQDGNTPTHDAAAHANEDALIFFDAYAPETLSTKNEYGQTPAHVAAAYANMDALKFFAKYAPETFYEDRYSFSPNTPVYDRDTPAKETMNFLRENRFLLYSDYSYDHDKYKKHVSVLSFCAENFPETLNGEMFIFLAKEYPEELPIVLFDKSKKHEEILARLFDSIKDDMNKNYDGTKQYVQKCEADINRINQIVDEKSKEYEEKNPLKAAFSATLSKLGKSKGE